MSQDLRALLANIKEEDSTPVIKEGEHFHFKSITYRCIKLILQELCYN